MYEPGQSKTGSSKEVVGECKYCKTLLHRGQCGTCQGKGKGQRSGQNHSFSIGAYDLKTCKPNTLKILKMRTPEKFAEVTLKFEQDGFAKE